MATAYPQPERARGSPEPKYNEAAFLGGLLADPDRAFEAAEGVGLEPRDLPSKGYVFAAALSLRERGEPVDAGNLLAEIDRRQENDGQAGVMLSWLMDQLPDLANLPWYAERLRKEALRRRAAPLAASLATNPDSLPELGRLVNELAFLDATEGALRCVTAPDLRVMGGYRRSAVGFPTDLLGRWAAWVDAAAGGAGVPVAYPATALLVFSAGALGNGARVSPWPGWLEPCVLWVALVGESSDGKSPALDPFRSAVDSLEASWAGSFEGERQAWEAAAAVAKAERQAWDEAVRAAVKSGRQAPAMPTAAHPPVEPGRPRLRVTDTTLEALAIILLANPRGVVMVRDELAAWVGGFGRYTGGGAGERAFWLEGFGGRSHTIDRVKGGAVRIDRLAVSLVGTATPDRLSEMFGDTNDGLAARFLWCWPEPLAPTIPRASADLRTLTDALGSLRRVSMNEGEPTTLRLEPDAVSLFQTWRVEHAEVSRGLSGVLASSYGKLPGIVLRLALILEMLEVAGQPLPAPAAISKAAVARGIGLVEGFFKPMADRVLGDASLPQSDRDAATLARWIAATRPDVVNARDLRRVVRLPGLTESTRVTGALEALRDAGWLEPAPSRQGKTRGRQRADFRIRQELLDALNEGR